MDSLKNVSDEQLQAELERRQEARVPKPLAQMDTTDVETACQDYIRQLAEEDYDDSDAIHYIFEAALAMVYGEDVWAWIRSKQG